MWDLFASALALRDIELGDLAPGEHAVEVSYDGELRARVALAVDRWRAESAPAAAPVAVATEEGPAVELSREVPAEVAVGEPVDLVFEVRSRGGVGPLVPRRSRCRPGRGSTGGRRRG